MLYCGSRGTMTPEDRVWRTGRPGGRWTGTFKPARGRFASVRVRIES
jgi:hypothetical protein